MKGLIVVFALVIAAVAAKVLIPSIGWFTAILYGFMGLCALTLVIAVVVGYFQVIGGKAL